MTGYGAAQQQVGDLSVNVELRAVNNRYLKLSLRTQEPYHLLEAEIEKVIRRFVRREMYCRTGREQLPGIERTAGRRHGESGVNWLAHVGR